MPVVSLSQSCELLADRSLCRPSGAPKPPGCGLQIRPRAPHSLHVQVCLENTSLGERDSQNVFEIVTIVKGDGTVTVTYSYGLEVKSKVESNPRA